MINLHLDETQKRLVDLWQAGKTSAEIGALMGITRNAVIGRIDRMRMRGVSIERSPGIHVNDNHKSRELVPAKGAGINWWSKAKPKTGVLLTKLRQDSCRYILPERHEGQHIYCGEPKERGSYCAGHGELCYSPVADVKKRMRDATKDVRRALAS